MEEVSIKIVTGTSKKTKKEWKGILITIGDWSQIIFPRTKFEMDYIVKTLESNK
jgi:hypothetical protein